MKRSFFQNKRGSVVTLFAFGAMVLSVMAAIVMTQISFYWSKRQLQSAVDMTALMILQSGDVSAANAKGLLAGQIADVVGNVVVTRGRYSPDSGKAASNRFIPNATPFNAVQLEAEVPATKVMFGGMMSDTLKIGASARAARRTSASVVMGSRLVRVEGGLSAALLDATLGYKGKLTIMDYESLASAKVDAAQFLQALNVKADIQALTFDDVLKAPVKVGDIASALAATTDDGDVLVLLNKAAPASGNKVALEKVIDLGAIKGLPLDSLASGQSFPLSVGELLAGSAALSDGDHQISVQLDKVLGDSSLANVSLDVGEKPQILNYKGYADEGAKLSTSQFRLNIGALGKNPLTAVTVDVTMANATVEIDEIKCKNDGSAEVKLKAVTEAASVGVKASLLPRIGVKLGNDEVKTLTFSQADINAQTYKPVRSGLGLQVGSLNIAQKLLFAPVDSLLETLGLHLAEADVKVIEANCGSAGLVY